MFPGGSYEVELIISAVIAISEVVVTSACGFRTPVRGRRGASAAT
jgi:hypothetical protein